jgi:alpha-L-fucosidase
MQRRQFCKLVAATAAATALPEVAYAAQGTPVRTGSLSSVLPGPLPAPASQDGKMAWFRESKYGLFIHWGLYSIPAGVWNGQPVRISSEWIMAHARIPVKDYAQLAKHFNPIHFNAEQWVHTARDAGMKYIVITAKHGDGFAMYRSQASAYNIYDATPFHRDPCLELAEACARHGMKLGFYYSQSVEWHEPGGMGNTWDFEPDAAKIADGAYDHYLQTKVEPQVRELLTHYGPICEMFFDTPSKMDENHRAQRIAELVHSLQPACLVNGRLGIPGDYATMGDNGIPSATVIGDWESPAELNHNWAFDQNDSDYKSPSQVVFNLMDIVSKGGNYLLDVGPTSSGVIPAVAVENLLTVGNWLKANGEAVYGAGRSPLGEGFKDYIGPVKDALGRGYTYIFPDWRCTTAPGKLNFTCFRWSPDFKLPPFKNEVKRAYLLGDPNRTDLPISVDEGGSRIVHAPHYAPNTMASVITVEVVGDVAPAATQAAASSAHANGCCNA